MADEQVIFDDVGPGLMRRILVMRVGEPVDADIWWSKIPAEAMKRATIFPYELGEKVKVHYLKLEWKPREIIGFEIEDRRLKIEGWHPTLIEALPTRQERVAVMIWWLEEGETISGGLRSAAELFWGQTGVWPKVGLIWKEPPSAELTVDGCQLAVRMARWVPKGCCVVL